MLVLYGDSLLSGFASTRHIPTHVRSAKTVLSDAPLVSIAKVIKDAEPNTEICALPGHGPMQVLQWFRQTPQWRDRPTLFWFGRCLRPIDPRTIAEVHAAMVDQMRAPWWICAIPGSARETNNWWRRNLVRDANRRLRDLAGDAFLDPVEAMGGHFTFKEEQRVDNLHPNCETNQALAHWLLEKTVKCVKAPTSRSICEVRTSQNVSIRE